MADGMKPVYILTDNLITSLGFTTSEHTFALERGVIGVKSTNDPELYPTPVQLSKVNTEQLELKFAEVLQQVKNRAPAASFTRLEKMFIVSVHEALKGSNVAPSNPRTLLVISTTKGNINLLEDRNKALFSHKRLYLWELGKVIRNFFEFENQPVIISNACISGIVALMTASRLVQSGAYDHAVVTGGDIATEFVISGFQSFQALSPNPCKPFDLNRTGLSLGEGCGTIVISKYPDPAATSQVIIAGASTSNDANHISGPSRTGEELSGAIQDALKQGGLNAGDISYISAHGTATSFNDEMESKAFELSGLAHVPVNSFKGYWGHTLGAAGIVESVAAISSLRNNILYYSAGFETLGVTAPLNVISENRPANLSACIKTASGFGGCNAAILYQKQ